MATRRAACGIALKPQPDAQVASSSAVQATRRAAAAAASVGAVVRGATPAVLDGLYPVAASGARAGLPPRALYGCTACYERALVPPGDGPKARAGWVSLALTNCGYGGRPAAWSLLLRFEAFDAVLYQQKRGGDAPRNVGPHTRGHLISPPFRALPL